MTASRAAPRRLETKLNAILVAVMATFLSSLLSLGLVVVRARPGVA